MSGGRKFIVFLLAGICVSIGNLPRAVFIVLLSLLLSTACLGQAAVQQTAVLQDPVDRQAAAAAEASELEGGAADPGGSAEDSLKGSPAPADAAEPAWAETPPYPRIEARGQGDRRRYDPGAAGRGRVPGALHRDRYAGDAPSG